jgi:hypothetical protein
MLTIATVTMTLLALFFLAQRRKRDRSEAERWMNVRYTRALGAAQNPRARLFAERSAG